MWKLETSLGLTNGPIDLKIQKAYEGLLHNDSLGFKNISMVTDSIESTISQKNLFNSFDRLVVIGLGGSSLGTKAICNALYLDHWREKVTFLDNIDAHAVDLFLNKIDRPEKLGWILCSKSGSTIEVLSLYEYCFNFLKEKFNVSIIAQSLSVTEFKPSPLFNFSKEKKIPLLEMPENVGGRFSVLTPIGLLPLQFLNFNMEKAKLGFEKVLKNSEIVCQLSSFLYHAQIQQKVSFYSFQYSNQLTQWSLWLQQLWSESLSKARTRDNKEAPIISTFIPCRGASDQHSVLQQIIEGRESKIVGFHRVKNAEKSLMTIKESLFESSLMKDLSLGQLMEVELLATEQAVRESGSMTFTLTTEELNEESISYLMGLWMLSVGVLGEALDINAFNQPGVESGKIITKQLLKSKSLQPCARRK